MPTEERAVKGAERCATHPTRATAATCAVCGRPLCVECAVPVRGRVLGVECLSEVLGEEVVVTAPLPAWRRRPIRSRADAGVGALIGVAALATLLPWTRFGTGSGFGGAWAFDQRWSIVAACAGVAGLAGWLLLGGRPAAARIVAIASGSIVAVGSLMAILNPPPFTKPALAPWIALVTGAGAAIVGLSARARLTAPHV
jgi:hypothetical protein